MKRAPLFIFIFLQTCALIYSESNSGHDLSLGLSFGILNGESEEVVYPDSKSNDLYSRLNWDIKPLFYAGVDLDYKWKSGTGGFGIFAGLGFKYCIPGYTGVAEDRDWIDNFGESTYPWLRLYSEHECYSKEAYLLDVNIGMTINLFYVLKLKVFLSYSMMYYSWLAENGSILYPPGFSPGHSQVSGDGIEYGQLWNIFSPGVSIYGSTNRFYDIEIFIKCSPFIWCHAVDNHIVTKTEYIDNTYSGFYIEPGFVISFRPYSFLCFSVSFDYRYLGGSRGDTTIKRLGYTDIIDYSAGAAYSAVNIALAAKYTFENLGKPRRDF